MISTFKIVSYLEGISFLLILFVTMPLKYLMDMPEANKTVGMAHGILFVAYVALAVLVKSDKNWNGKTLGIVLICSLIPFGTFWMDKKYL
ncbi:DUF3817 domain-containing protein [Aquimarina intermedia]|uniref:Integral membrane protein n=1 Tax=Aquimarina intermedia TaxID=350814 RepID=A0A5S5C6Y5_9FLAO|nr:DUF3817 domain-containing protein [Aquimarina intermedia]TYP75191.1 integral membrane protein [Aquimarina intermedia]